MLDDLLDEYDDLEDSHAGTVVGIDLGTTNSVIATVQNGEVIIIVDAQGNRLHPSTVAWMPDGSELVGQKARARRAIDPANTVTSAKRIIGHPYSSQRVTEAKEHLSYEVCEGDNEEVLIATRAGKFTVPEISAKVLAYLKALAEAQLKVPVSHCVVTVPANFSDAQRYATRRAAELAGMNVLRVLNEPTAAALAYSQNRRVHQRIAVFDLGGGTFDVTALAMRNNVFEVLATGGDPFLGGDDVDGQIYRRLATAFLKKHRVDADQDPAAKTRLMVVAEQIKCALSDKTEVSGTLTELAHGEGGKPLDLEFRFDQDTLNQLINPLIATTLKTTEQVLKEAELTPQLIDEIILVGGSTRIPWVRQRVQEAFGKAPQDNLDPMEVVAIGTALQANRLQNPRMDDGVLLDVTPHSLRIATVSGYSQVLVEKNATIPAEGTRTFYTAREGQDSVRIQIAQGESETFSDNAYMGELLLTGLPATQSGKVGVRVTFTIDADGILQVSARELSGNQSTQAVLSIVGSDEMR